MLKTALVTAVVCGAILLASWASGGKHRIPPTGLPAPRAEATRLLSADFAQRLSEAALARTAHQVRYDGAYFRIPYPMGDVPPHIGVCTDVVIRTYRALGIDLQKEVHEDMAAHFSLYPKKWGLRRPDTNIDHRRVLNLEVFLARKGLEVAATMDPEDYLPGDLVTWTVAGSLPHIGIVVDRKAEDGKTPLIVHNIGRGDVLEDMLFSYPITGHFRYGGPKAPGMGGEPAGPSR